VCPRAWSPGRCSGSRRARWGDAEIRRIIDDGYARATSILDQHRDLLDRLARELIGKETLDASALEHIFQAA